MRIPLRRRRFIELTALSAISVAVAPRAFGQPNRKIVVAFVGCAHIHTGEYVNLLKSRKDVIVKWVWDHDEARAGKCAANFGSKVTTSAQDIWNDPEVQVAVICSETNRHLELVEAGAKAGKNLFVEKPLGMNSTDSNRMAQAIEKAGVLFTTGYFMRTDPKHLFIREEIAKGHFGKITKARGSCCHNGSLEGWFDHEWGWMADPKQSGVGAFGDMGTHKLDILMWLLGDVARATADIQVVTGRYKDCDESGVGLLHFANGTTGTLSAGWVDVDDPVPILVSGTDAHAIIFNGQLYYKSKHVEGATGSEPWMKLPAAPPPPLDQLLNAVNGEKDQPLVSVREAASRVTVMEAMYKASRLRQWVDVA